MSNENLLILDPTKINLHPSEVERTGTNITVSTSPYDVPEALQAYKNAQDGTLVIKVKYMGPEEPTDVSEIEAGVCVRTGRNSKRLYEFIFRAYPSLTVDTLRHAVGVLIQSKGETRYSRKDNYRLLYDVISDHSDKVANILAFTNVKTK